MAQANSQHKLDRVRSPRVHITYDVEVGDAIELRSLPFQLAVLGDFTGMPEQPLARLRDRTFVEVNPDNFDAVLEGMQAHLAFTVENRLAGTEGAPALRVDLHFKTLEDFEPANVAAQIRPLRELIELRTKLNDLLGKLQGNDRLEELLTDAITDPSKLKKLESEIQEGNASIAAPLAGAKAISVEPQALVEPNALDGLPEAGSVNLAGVMASASNNVEAAVEATTLSDEENALPTEEPEQVELAPEGAKDTTVAPPIEEEQVTPGSNASVTDIGGEVEEKKESEGSEEVRPTEDKAG